MHAAYADSDALPRAVSRGPGAVSESMSPQRRPGPGPSPFPPPTVTPRVLLRESQGSERYMKKTTLLSEGREVRHLLSAGRATSRATLFGWPYDTK
jgi:hypothetical protein